jgi:hypothetical protein
MDHTSLRDIQHAVLCDRHGRRGAAAPRRQHAAAAALECVKLHAHHGRWPGECACSRGYCSEHGMVITPGIVYVPAVSW